MQSPESPRDGQRRLEIDKMEIEDIEINRTEIDKTVIDKIEIYIVEIVNIKPIRIITANKQKTYNLPICHLMSKIKIKINLADPEKKKNLEKG